MKKLKIIEMPREEIRLDALEKAMVGAGDNCGTYSLCKTSTGDAHKCMTFNDAPCSCGGNLYCHSYTF